MPTVRIKGYLSKVLWVIPFFFALFGYWGAHMLFGGDVVSMPSLVGLPLHQAVPELSGLDLNIRIVGFKEDPDLEAGVVVSQSPFCGQQIRQGQAAHIVVTRRPPSLYAPRLAGLLPGSVQAEIEKFNIVSKVYTLYARQPKGVCLAQLPAPGTRLEKKRMTIYTATMQSKPLLLPNFVGCDLEQVKDLLAPYGVMLKVRGARHKGCVVREQRPLAGSFLHTDKPCSVQVHVR
jgi:beta-lactam-binding protein with PASTA domain